MRQIVLAATLFGALAARAADAQTTQTVYPPSADYVGEACNTGASLSSDPRGLLVFGTFQYQNLYTDPLNSIVGPVERLLPPNSTVPYWDVCEFGNTSQAVTIIPGAHLNYYGADLLGGQGSGGDAEFETFAGSIFELTPVAGWTSTVLHAFAFRDAHGAPTPDGDGPTGLVRATDGALFGGTFEGGPNGGGAVFRLTAPASSGSPWNEAVLHAFGGSQGSVPVVALVGPDGSVYGTTEPSADKTVAATVWRLKPGASGWVLTVLHRFTEASGSALSSLVRGTDGSLYGTVGASRGGRSLFRLTPRPDATYGYHVVFQFPVPATTVTGLSFVAGDGTLYGFSAYYGSPCAAGSCGRVWQLKPSAPPAAGFTATVLHDFTGDPVADRTTKPVSFVRLSFLRESGSVALSSSVALYGVVFGGVPYQPYTLIRISEQGWR